MYLAHGEVIGGISIHIGILERDTGLEPVTFCLASRHSTTELIPRRRLFMSSLRSGHHHLYAFDPCLVPG